MLVAFDREAEPLLEVLGWDRGLGRQPDGLRRPRPSSRARGPRSPRASPVVHVPSPTEDMARPELDAARGSRRRGTRRAAWSSGGRRSRRRPAREGRRPEWRRAAGRRAAAGPRGVRRGRRGSRRVQAVGAVQGSAPGQASPGVMPKRVPCGDAGGPACGGRLGRGAGWENGRTAQAAAESSPDSGSPDSPHQAQAPRVVSNAAPAETQTRLRRGDGVAEVVAGVALLVVGAVAPGERDGWAAARPAARAATAAQPAASPWAARPGTGAPLPSKRAAAPRSRPSEEAGDPPRLGAVAGGGEGERGGRRRRAARRRPSRRGHRPRPRRCGGRSAPAGRAASAGTSAAPSPGAPGRAAGRGRASGGRRGPRSRRWRVPPRRRIEAEPGPRVRWHRIETSPPLTPIRQASRCRVPRRGRSPAPARSAPPSAPRSSPAGSAGAPGRPATAAAPRPPPTRTRGTIPVSAGTVPAAWRAAGLSISARPAGPGARRSTTSP